MNRLILITTILCCSLVFFSCEKEIKFKGEANSRKLVVNTDFTPDSIWNINVSHSLSLGETGAPGPVTDAVVRIKNDAGTTIATLDHSSNGNYTSNLQPVPLENYTVQVEAAGYNEVSATSYAPVLGNITLIDTGQTTFLGSDVFSVTLELNDPAATEDYYVIDFEVLMYDSLGLYDQFNTYGFSIDPNNDNGDLGDENSFYSHIFFKDENFNGQSYQTTFQIDAGILRFLSNPDPFGWGGGAPQFVRIDLKTRIRSVSKDLYTYLKSYDKYEAYSFDPTFAQPVQVYTNIENGFGIFGGYSAQSLDFVFE